MAQHMSLTGLGTSFTAAARVVALAVLTSAATTLQALEHEQEPIDATEFEIALEELRSNLDTLVLIGRFYQEKAQETDDKSYSQRAFAYWLVAADQGNTEAAFRTGWAYDFAIGTNQDFSQARYWYEKAADANHVRALRSLASLYELGKDSAVEQDEGRALSLYMRAVELGDSISMVRAGDMLVKGRGSLRDLGGLAILRQWSRLVTSTRVAK